MFVLNWFFLNCFLVVVFCVFVCHLGWEEITESLIMEELDRMKMEKDMSDDDLKIPNADNLKNISASKGTYMSSFCS